MKASSIKNSILVFLIVCILSAICFRFPALSVSPAVVYTPKNGGVFIPIIMYHGLLRDSGRQNEYVISPDIFENDLAYLREKGFTTVVMDDLIRFVRDGTPLPEKPIMLTFDDGYYNNYVYAYPLLEKYDARIVISPIASVSEVYTDSGEINPYYTHITWDMIREMVASGRVEIQNHSYALHSNTYKRRGAAKSASETEEAYKKTLTEDLLHAQNLLKDKTGVVPTTFVYPFGAVSDSSEKIVRSIGFSATMTCESKINEIRIGDVDCLFGLGRFRRTNYTDSRDFFENKVKLFQYFPKEDDS